MVVTMDGRFMVLMMNNRIEFIELSSKVDLQ